MPGPFTIIRTVNRNYWREGLESKEETSSTKFCCGSRTGAAQGREGCGKDGEDARNTLVRVGKRKGRREEALRSFSLLQGKGSNRLGPENALALIIPSRDIGMVQRVF